MDSGAHAKAIRDWADDGSDDTRLERDKNSRLTYVTDALGDETRYYYDIAGYNYRVVHPDGRRLVVPRRRQKRRPPHPRQR